jgi:hypothetical protein
VQIVSRRSCVASVAPCRLSNMHTVLPSFLLHDHSLQRSAEVLVVFSQECHLRSVRRTPRMVGSILLLHEIIFRLKPDTSMLERAVLGDAE